jgi:hypothetical protein
MNIIKVFCKYNDGNNFAYDMDFAMNLTSCVAKIARWKPYSSYAFLCVKSCVFMGFN